MLFMLRFFICKDKAYKNASIIIKSLSENINDEEEPKKVHLITIDEATQLVEGITKYQLRKLIKSREIPRHYRCLVFLLTRRNVISS